MTNLTEFINFCDEMEIVTEGVNTITDEKSLIDNLSIVYEHMLKLKFKSEDQNSTWFTSVLEFIKKI